MTTHPEASAAPVHRAPDLTPDLKKKMYEAMVTSRVIDEVTISMNRSGQGFFWIGGPGEEAFGVSLGMQVKKGCGPDFDYLHLHYRSNPILVAMGARPIDTLRQMRSTQTDPYSGGRNFVNHYAIHAWNVTPVTPTIETQYVMAPGTAWVQKRHGGDGLTIVNGGDAGSAEGDFASCLNWATRPGCELPILIIVNHNGFGISTPAGQVQSSGNLARRAEPYGIRWAVVDGNDVLESWKAIAEAMYYIRTERKPFCLQANVSRLHGHSSASGGNRVPDEVDPILRFEAHLEEEGLLSRAECEATWERIRAQMKDDLRQVLSEPLATDRDRFIYFDGERPEFVSPDVSAR
ncbi:MAG: thiamine pyrophosphate-dependent dehydrogenase E1 component subunit alpha [Candidatus Sericytochromatia bacterium]|nr:thiamine pyrophosphate-dependent dehydrogenase E1 component subunit alpha [Candidatus Sericytochromatia bacterium]